MSKAKPEGIVVPLSTPLYPDQSYDAPSMNRLIEHVIAGGVQGVFALGTCGEQPYLRTEEIKLITTHVVNSVGSRVPVYVGIGQNSTVETCEIAEHAKYVGADYGVVLPPYFFRDIEKDQLIKHYTEIAKVGLDIVLYVNPIAANLELDTVAELAKLENIVALKYSSGDSAFLKSASEILPTFQGDDPLIYNSMVKCNAVGGVPGAANVIPAKFVELFDLIRNGQYAEAEELQEKVNEFVKLLYDLPRSAQAGVKQGLVYLGICGGTMRSPNPEVSPENAEKINSFLRDNLES